MAFNSNSGSQAGKKSKRGPSKQVGKVRQLILDEIDTGRLRYALAELDNLQYVKSMSTLLQYSVPRLSSVSLTSLDDVQEALETLSDDELRIIAQTVLKRLESTDNE